MRKLLTALFGCAVAIVFATFPSNSLAVFDDFSDGNDTASPPWVHLNGLVLSSGQTWDASTGEYRMQAPNNGFQNLGFAGSYVPQSFTNVLVKADVLSFVDGPSQGGPFAIAARLDGDNDFNELKGYAYAYEPQADGGLGEMAMYRINGLDLGDMTPIGVEGTDWVRKVTLDPNKDYTMSLRIQGTTLRGEVREIGGPLVAYQTNVDAVYASGYSGLFGYSRTPIPPLDLTWDNFSSQVPEPASALLTILSGMGAVLLAGRRR